tara:strand:- start:432 stop:803 length:372 start_codon:yes stop_codon:yes gene_type:complete
MGRMSSYGNPAIDYLDKTLDLNDLCIRRPAATYLVRAEGDSMINAGIFDSDILIVDRSVKALHNHIVIASLNGDFLCKRLHLTGDTPQLIAENPAYNPIILSGESELEIFGVVTYVIHSLASS